MYQSWRECHLHSLPLAVTMKSHPSPSPSSATAHPSLILSIVRLHQSIDRIDRPIAETVTRVLDQLSCAAPSDAVSFDGVPSTPKQSCRLRERVEKSIMRYRLDRDRWTSLASLLLKSLAYHRSVDDRAPSPCVVANNSNNSGEMEKADDIAAKHRLERCWGSIW